MSANCHKSLVILIWNWSIINVQRGTLAKVDVMVLLSSTFSNFVFVMWKGEWWQPCWFLWCGHVSDGSHVCFFRVYIWMACSGCLLIGHWGLVQWDVASDDQWWHVVSPLYLVMGVDARWSPSVAVRCGCWSLLYGSCANIHLPVARDLDWTSEGTSVH